MRVLYVEPPLSLTPTGIEPRHPPQMALYSAALLRRAGHDVQVIDAFLEDLSLDETLARTLQAAPELVVLVPFDYTRETEPRVTVELAQRLGRELPGLPVGLAGSVDRPLFERCLREAPALRFAVVGEYEHALLQVAARGGDDLDGIPGLLVRRGTEVAFTGPGVVVDDLADLPYPAWDLVDFARYTFVPHRYKRVPMYPLLASRGCPFACLCCKETKYAKITRYRLRSVADVIAEIRWAQQRWGAREIQFSDATFGIRPEWVKELCEALRRERLDVTWSALMRADLMTPDVLEPMARAGCWNVLVGVESANQHALDIVHKRITPDLARSAVRAAKAAGLTVTTSFILGLPGEDRADVLRTIDFAVELDPDYAQFFVLKHYGEDGEFDAWGRVEDTWDLSPHDFRGPVFVGRAFRDRTELKDLQRLAYRRFYLRPRYVAKRLPDLMSPAQARRAVVGLATLLRASFLRH